MIMNMNMSMKENEELRCDDEEDRAIDVMVMTKLGQVLPTCVAGQLNIILFYEYEGS